jgi:hypothetical protein
MATAAKVRVAAAVSAVRVLVNLVIAHLLGSLHVMWAVWIERPV